MSFCRNCGANVPDNTPFCAACGAPVDAQPQPQPPYQQPYGAPNGNNGVSFGQRNIAVAIILSIVTCGIYGIIWLINMADQINEASGNPNGTSGGMVFLLSIVTCSIYLYYWFYKAGDSLHRAKMQRGIPSDSNSGVLYLVLGIFGLSLVAYALIQNELNKIAEYHGAPRA
ncbi:MAG: DUF4234 domain-containing protein [Clostridia bacterium]|nr:DUF4234 domain-containing protein [Clostridia bacterium]